LPQGVGSLWAGAAFWISTRNRHEFRVAYESQYDPTKVRRAEVVLQELLGERGRQFASVKAEPKRVPPNSVILTFKIDEGPKVKVGLIEFTGNQAISDRALRLRIPPHYSGRLPRRVRTVNPTSG
jgi:hypothetical protein